MAVNCIPLNAVNLTNLAQGNGSEMPAAKQIYAYNFHQLLATQCGGLLHPVLPMF